MSENSALKTCTIIYSYTSVQNHSSLYSARMHKTHYIYNITTVFNIDDNKCLLSTKSVY